MGTGESLTAAERVQRLPTALHAKAKEAPGFRFYSLSDKVWRDDVLTVAWQAVRRNGTAHVYTDTRYAARTWDHERRVVKAEVVRLGDDHFPTVHEPRTQRTSQTQVPRISSTRPFCASPGSSSRCDP